MKALDKFSSGPGGRRRSDGRKGADHVHAQRSRQAHPRRRAVQIGAKGGMAAASDAAQKKIYGAVSGFAQRLRIEGTVEEGFRRMFAAFALPEALAADSDEVSEALWRSFWPGFGAFAFVCEEESGQPGSRLLPEDGWARLVSSLLPLHIYRPLSDGGHLVRVFRLVCDPHGDPYGDADPSQLYFSYTNLLEGLCHIVAEVARLPVTRGKKHADAAAARGKANAPPPPVGASPLAWLKWIVLPSRLLKLAQHPAAALRATLAADADVQAVLRAQRPRLVALFRALLAKLGDADATTLPADALVARLSWCGVLGVHTVASADGGAPSRAELSEHEVRAAALASYGALLVRRYPRPAVVLLTVDEVAEALYRCGDALYSEVESMPAPRRLEAVFDHICGRSTVADQLRGAAPRSQFAPLRGESPAMFEAWRGVWKAMGLGEWQGAAGWEADAYSLLHSHFALLCALFAAHGGGGPLETIDGARLPRVGWRRLLGRLSLDADAGPLGDAAGAPLSVAAAIQAIVYLSLPPARRPPLSQIPNLLADVPKADPFDAPAARRRRTTVARAAATRCSGRKWAPAEKRAASACPRASRRCSTATLRRCVRSPLAPRRGSG